MSAFDAILVVSFGGPEGPDDVMPFLENVLRGKNVPEARKLQVAENYKQFGGVSPINAQNRELISKFSDALQKEGIALPVYWGNRNWKPYIKDALREMHAAGVRSVLAYATSAYSSYSGCRQYLEDIDRARADLSDQAPQVAKIREFHNHPLFIQLWAENISVSLQKMGRLVFTAHSIPKTMSDMSDYLVQLQDTATLIAKKLGVTQWDLAFQSRSGPPTQPWLEPDILTHLEALSKQGVNEVVVAPIGFVSDHLEVVYDLDRQAREKAEQLGMKLVRVPTPGASPLFIGLLVELIRERLDEGMTRRYLGDRGAGKDVCPPDCCRFVHKA